MTAAVRATGTPSNTGSALATTFSPTMPTNIVVGELLIGIVVASNSTAPSTRPSGSTSVLNFVDGTVWSMDVVRKVATGGDTFTWTVGSGRAWAGVVLAVAAGSFDLVTPIQGAAGLALGTTAVTAVPSPSATPGNSDSLIIAAFGMTATGTWSTSDGSPSMTEICDTASTTPAVKLGVYRSNSAPAASAITRNATSTVSSANGGGFIMFVNPGVVIPRVERLQRSPRPAEQPQTAGPYSVPVSGSQFF